jgi:hypothetical protein
MTDKKHLNRILSKIKFEAEIKECFHHVKSECSPKIKNAHSISRGDRLNLIKGLVNKNDKVFSLGEIIIDENPKKGVKEIGWGKAASTFFGFCDDHDTNLFEPIENGNQFDNSKKHCFLHSYRSFAYSYHQAKKARKAIRNFFYGSELLKIKAEINNISCHFQSLNISSELALIGVQIPIELPNVLISQIQNVKKELKAIRNKLSEINFSESLFPDFKYDIRSLQDLSSLISDVKIFCESVDKIVLHCKKLTNSTEEELNSKGFHLPLSWLTTRKEKLDTAIEKNNYDSLTYYAVVKDGLFPLAAAYAFIPEITYDSVFHLQENATVLNPPCIIVTILPDHNGKTIILFACFKGDKSAEFYLKKLLSLESKDDFERAVSSLLIFSGTNTYLNPSLWQALGEKQEIIEKELNYKRKLDNISEKPFMSSINFFQDEYSAAKLDVRTVI